MNNAKHVLVVEDDPRWRAALARLLEKKGYLVRCAADGLEALDCLRTAPRVGVILLDLNVPVLDGWEFLRRRQLDPAMASIPVIVVSALGEAAARGGAPGGVDYLQKPVDVEELFAAVERCFTAARRAER
jgi:CheY-like chemotaxis protein